eukprot:Lithocolla_globosa_v1_NODE_633_length_3549_cov_27.117916.p1 type:complete len:513 gc:universal NODE_633_length_3549_cov_27.117916:2630-1092(-)
MTGYRGPHQSTKAETILSLDGDVYALTEHWLMLNDQLDDIKGYEWFGINRPTRTNAIRGHGGVGFLVRKTNAHLVKPLVTDVEDMYLISLGDTRICLAYIQKAKSKTENNSRRERICDTIQTERQKCSMDQKFILVGDLNARTGESQDWVDVEDLDSDIEDDEIKPLKSVRTSEDKITNINGDRLLQYCKDFNDKILNGRLNGQAKFTFTGHFGKSVIDIFVANKSAHLATSDLRTHDEVTSVCSNFSGHFPVSIQMDIKEIDTLDQHTDNTLKLPNLKNANWSTFEKVLQDKSSNVTTELQQAIQKLETTNKKRELIDELWELIKSTLYLAESSSFQNTPSKKHHRKPEYFQKWFDLECAEFRSELSAARQHARNNNHLTDHYLKLDQEYKKTCRRKKRLFEDKITKDLEQELFNNTNNFWAKYKSMNRTKKNLIPWSAIDESGTINSEIKNTLKVWVIYTSHFVQTLAKLTQNQMVLSSDMKYKQQSRKSTKINQQHKKRNCEYSQIHVT